MAPLLWRDRQNPLCTNSFCPPPGTIPTTGYGDAFQNLFNSTAPDKGVGVNLNIPLRNRQVQADQVRSELEYRQAQMSLQQTENTIRLQVRQAQFALQQNYVALQAAIAARDYAAQKPRRRAEEAAAWGHPPAPWCCRPPAT